MRQTRKAVRFDIEQTTPSFPDGAPDRAEYISDDTHLTACALYAEEWRKIYVCNGCLDLPSYEHRLGRMGHGPDCPDWERP